ncbi:MAG: tandem-95 repeat protein [Chitinophagales bacterium]|nr:tandem-95 repeat protein [Chitinophagales bacterium]
MKQLFTFLITIFCMSAVVQTVHAQNSPPVVLPDTASTAEDAAVIICPPISDADGDSLIINWCSAPANGSVNFVSGNCIMYVPYLNYTGADSVCLLVCDTLGLCDSAVILFVVTPVNDSPILVDDYLVGSENTAITINVLANDSDPEGNVSGLPTIVSPPANGTAIVNSSGTITYTPNTGFVGSDTFFYALCDDDGLCDTAMVIVAINKVNQPPVANNDFITTVEPNPITITVLANDSDPEGELNGLPAVIVTPANGSANVNMDGTITYTPDSSFAGTDTFYYVICDAGNPPLCDTAMVVVTVLQGPKAPTLTVGSIVTPPNQSEVHCFPFTTESGVDSVAATITCNTVNASIDSIYVQNGNVCVVYTPTLNFSGTDTFCITLCDLSNGLCVTQAVPVTVTTPNVPCYWLKGFSPNGDGQNDAFIINCNDQYPDATLQVFNRWGELVWKSDGHYNNNFVGKNEQDKELPDGTYYYIYSYKNGGSSQQSGYIQITR